jgi:general secretion pathway protein G
VVAAALGFAVGFAGTPLLISFANGVFMNGAPSVEQKIALATTRQLVLALDEYRTDHFRLPDQRSGLEALVPSYLVRIPVDPWGHPYVYSAGADGLWADVLSYGSDGGSGGTDAAGDISGRFGLLAPGPSWFVRLLTQGTFLLIPLLGLAGAADRWWAAGMLAGCASLFALLLLAMIDAFGVHTLLALPVAIACLSGSIAMFWRLPGASLFTFLAFILAYALLGELVTT